jgi:hypothetical protein
MVDGRDFPIGPELEIGAQVVRRRLAMFIPLPASIVTDGL